VGFLSRLCAYWRAKHDIVHANGVEINMICNTRYIYARKSKTTCQRGDIVPVSVSSNVEHGAQGDPATGWILFCEVRALIVTMSTISARESMSRDITISSLIAAQIASTRHLMLVVSSGDSISPTIVLNEDQ
jgi:hypothetical protein